MKNIYYIGYRLIMSHANETAKYYNFLKLAQEYSER